MCSSKQRHHNHPVKHELSLDFTSDVSLCEGGIQGAEHKIKSALTPPVGSLTEVQLLEAEMHFLSSHHWHPLVLAVQLAQSENR